MKCICELWFALALQCSNRFLVCPMRHAAVIMNIDGTHKIVPLEDEVSCKDSQRIMS